jgi:hypothetical protein
MSSFVGEIDSEPGKNGVNGLDAPEAPASMHAKTAGRELDQSLDVVPLKLSSGRHFLEFFSHN